MMDEKDPQIKELDEVADMALCYIDQLYADDPTLLRKKQKEFKEPFFANTQAQTKANEPALKPLPSITPPVVEKKEDSPSLSHEKPPVVSRAVPLASKAIAKPVVDSLHDMQQLLKKLSPESVAKGFVPSDHVAKKIKQSWKNHLFYAEVIILAGSKESALFLENVAKAIKVHFRPCTLMSIEELEKADLFKQMLGSTALKLIIASDVELWNSKELVCHFHEIPQKKERYLGKKPLLLIPDTSLYMKDASLKRSLWNQLCQVMQSM